MALAIVPLIAAVCGALVYALAGNAKAAELGRITFACAMLVLMAALASKVVRF